VLRLAAGRSAKTDPAMHPSVPAHEPPVLPTWLPT
jgi:hypothetical protein